MITRDINIYECGSGGEISVVNGDILLGSQLLLQPYLAMFGGNVEAATRGDEVSGQIRSDWWANSLLFSDSKSKQFNSNTERALRDNPLNSTGRNNIINAVKSDLSYLGETASVSVDATILSAKQLKIIISLTDIFTGQTAIQQLLWDNAKAELVIEKII